MSHSSDPERLAVLVHEVRSPVAALSAVAEAGAEAKVGGDVESEARRELVRLALAACAAIERIVLDLAVSSVEASEVDVGAVATDVSTSYRLRGADVLVELDQGQCNVRGDSVRLRQVLDNLVTNGLVHGRSPEPVRISVRRTGSCVVVVVADSGNGIPPAELDRIFEPGVRLDSTAPGSGIGLALTRAIVEAHEGTIAVESSAGHGTTFTVSLPASDPHPATEASTT